MECEAAQYITTVGAFKSKLLYCLSQQSLEVVMLCTKAQCGVVLYIGSSLSNYMDMLQNKCSTIMMFT